MTSLLTIRLATDEDAEALAELALTDHQHVPHGPLLVALRDERYVAAMALDSYAWIADPYSVSEPAVRLLRERVHAITGRPVPRPRGLRAPSLLRALVDPLPRS